jgi:hypothetical protein
VIAQFWVVLLTCLLLAAHAGAPAADAVIDASAASCLVDDEVDSHAVLTEATSSKLWAPAAGRDARLLVSELLPRVFRPPRT